LAGRRVGAHGPTQPRIHRGATARFLLVAEDPQAVMDAAVHAGGNCTSPVAEEHGWLLGRVVDPFGHEWEIGRPLGAWPPAT
jgi:PhnB protein